jgi:hypothetical protein
MSKRLKDSVKRINETVSIVQILSTLGFDVREDAGDREQQFRCDLHGSGHDDTPSARVYPDSNSWYCFGCGVTRDAIETLQVKQGVAFWAAIKMLEAAHGLDPLPIDYDADEQGQGALAEVRDNLASYTTFADEETRTRASLEAMTSDRELPLDRLLSFWEGFDKAVFMVRGPRGDGGVWGETKGRKVLAGLRDRMAEVLLEHRRS